MDRLIKILLLSTLVVLMTLFELASGQEKEKEEDFGAIVVSAIGLGPLIEGGVAPARKAAIEDALKQAVEQARGVMIHSETLVKDFTTVRDEILAKSKGFVKRYEIVQEKKVETDGVYRVEIRAAVMLSDPKIPPVALDKKNFQSKAPKILAEVEELSRRTDEVGNKLNAREVRGFRPEALTDLDQRYRSMIQLLNSIQPPPGKEPEHERLKEAVILKGRATFLYGQFILRERKPEILQRANQMNKIGNRILFELRRPTKSPQTQPPQPPLKSSLYESLLGSLRIR